jgi:hypothetical protein
VNVEETVTNTASSTDTISATITAAAETLIVAVLSAYNGSPLGEWSQSAGWTLEGTAETRQTPVVFWKFNDTAGDVTFTADSVDRNDGTTPRNFGEAALHLIEISGARLIDYSLTRAYTQWSNPLEVLGRWIISREGNIGIMSAHAEIAASGIAPPTGFSTCAETDGTGWCLATYWAALPYATSYSVLAPLDSAVNWYSMSIECDLDIPGGSMIGSDF